MTDLRLPSSGNIQIRWHADGAFANPKVPTPTEINAGLIITNDISWNDFDFGLSASNTNSDPSLAAKSNTSDRGATQYGGGISLYLPADPTDMTNSHAIAYAALKEPRTYGWISMQIDGELSETNVPTYAGGIVRTAASGDFVHVFKVLSGGYSNAITGEEAFRETVNFLPQGEAYPFAVIASALTLVVDPTTAVVADGDNLALTATVNGRDFTHGVRWSSADNTLATVSQGGIVTRIATGSVIITATYAGTTGTATLT